MKIEEIDPNFKTSNADIENTEIEYYDIKNAPFKIYGLYDKENYSRFERLPMPLAQDINEGTAYLSENTSGGRIRFSTDSEYIVLAVKYPNIEHMAHIPIQGSGGFDMYSYEDGKYTYLKTFQPPIDKSTSINISYKFNEKKMRDIIIFMPTYNKVSGILVGLEKASILASGGKYKNKPVVFYGSSITQGGCASRPALSYPATLSRRLDFDFINLGFSGNAKGEQITAEYIADLDMSCFVLDYDHNAPTAEHLEKTHEAFYKTVRAKHKDLPIIMMTMPFATLEDFKKRRDIIYKTYKNAKDNGENVYFIDVFKELLPYDTDGTVDNCHPNDLGMALMADAVEKVLRLFIPKI